MFEQPTEELQQSVCENLNTTLSQLQRDVQTLRQWLSSQPHLPQCSSDAMLTSYMIACKNRIERAKEKIENFYTARNQIPEFFEDRDPLSERVQENKEEIRLFVMPKLTPDGCRLAMMSLVSGDPKKYNYLPFGIRVMMIEDIKMNSQPFNNGTYFVYDGKHFSFSHIFKLSPTMARNLLYCTQDALPVKIKALIFINAPSYLPLLLSIAKPFMKAKLINKICIHTEGPEVLEKYFPRAMLPKDYGGEEETRDALNDYWMKCLEDNRDWFLHEGSLKVDEDKRVKVQSKKKNKTTETENSLKTLCID